MLPLGIDGAQLGCLNVGGIRLGQQQLDTWAVASVSPETDACCPAVIQHWWQRWEVCVQPVNHFKGESTPQLSNEQFCAEFTTVLNISLVRILPKSMLNPWEQL